MTHFFHDLGDNWMLNGAALGACILLTSLAQLFLKIGSARKARASMVHSVFDPYTICGYGLFFLNTIVLVYVMQFLEFKTVSTASSVSYLCVVLLARFVLKEKMTLGKLVGCMLVVAGIVVFEMG
jgi:drug/metabolite transporter (DMT)-like permease